MRSLAACVLVIAAALPSVAAAGPTMLKGPYLQDLAPRSITVMWQLETPAPAVLTIDGPGGERSQEVEASRITESTITGLQPATRYRYKVTSAGGTWTGEFATAPEIGADVPVTFVVIGDTRSGTDAHRRVIERMSQEVPDFVLGTGDMVDEGHRQDQWQQFFDVENPMLRDNVFFPALGNHDRQGRGRTADTYRSYFSVPENGDETERYYAFTHASSRFLVLDSNEYSFALTDQTSWIERELIASRQDPAIRHIFCVMHHPPFSISLHGGNRDLRERWTPLFEKYNVTAVFSGHDHVYERAEHNGIRYFVTGGGGAPLYARRPRPDPVDAAATKKYERTYHYLRVSLTGNRVEITGVRPDGTTIETTTWTEGPEPKPATQASPPVRIPLAGAPAAIPVPRAPAAATQAHQGGSLWWIGFGGIGLLLAAALVVARTLRR
ncbi:MAG: metallophosphoesterase family protein [Deltaproteobacteria bacterium]|nr:metallophosphoesterase family protein [Deltaproteobacteria bacterium]